MKDPRDLMIDMIEANAWARVGRLAHRLVRAPSEERELILAELEFHRWLAESCQFCQIVRRRQI